MLYWHSGFLDPVFNLTLLLVRCLMLHCDPEVFHLIQSQTVIPGNPAGNAVNSRATLDIQMDTFHF